jgi:hypothetical protein
MCSNKYKLPVLLLCLAIFACSDPQFPIPKSYPVLYNSGATDINESGATLTATLSLPAGEEIIEFGFLVQENSEVFQIPLESWKSTNDFTYRLTSDLVGGQRYVFRPYAKTADQDLIGGTKSFVAQGKSTPEILDFFPKTGTIQTPITIIGKNLSALNTQLYFEGNGRGGRLLLANELIKGDVDTIRFRMGYQSLYNGIDAINIFSDQTELALPGTLQLLEPAITGIDKTRGFLGETEFTLSFENFDPSQPGVFSIGFRDAAESGPQFQAGRLVNADETSYTFTSGSSTLPGDKNIIFRLGPDIEYQLEGFNLVSRWERIGQFPGSSFPLFSKVFNNEVFVFTDRGLWVYNLSTGQWRQKDSHPGNISLLRRLNFAVGDDVFSAEILGQGAVNRFDTDSETWSQLSDIDFLQNSNGLGIERGNRFHFLSAAETNPKYITYNAISDSWTQANLNIPTQVPPITGREPNFTRNGELYFLPNPENNNWKLFKADISGNSPLFSQVSEFSTPDLNGSLASFYRGNVLQTDEQAIITVAIRTANITWYSWVYDFASGELKRTDNYITQDLFSEFTHESNAYGIAWNVDQTTSRGLYRFRKTLD